MLAGDPETLIVINALGTSVPVKVGEGVSVCVGDGPAVPVLVGVGGVPVTVFVGLGVIVSVGPKWAFFNTIGRLELVPCNWAS